MALGVDGVRVGCWTDEAHHTGTTVVLPPQGTLGAASVRGAAPGTREVAALSGTGNVTECHAVVLSGGSAFGLATADGVVAWCEAHGIGYDKRVARIPIVGGAIVFDLRQRGAPRPDRDAGWAACEAATEEDPAMGSVGVGAGCTVGKTAGLEWGSKGGQGWATVSAGAITVGALMAVNPLGDVIGEDGRVLAGCRAPEDAPRYPAAALPEAPEDAPGSDGPSSPAETPGARRADGPAPAPEVAENTVIGCLVTNARLEKHAAARAADLCHTGVARAVDPAHTTADGDALFLLCTRRVEAPLDLVIDLGTQAVSQAIRAAVRHATGIPGFPADPRAARSTEETLIE